MPRSIDSPFIDHRLDRDAMFMPIAEGRSVLYKPPGATVLEARIITDAKDVPSEAELAGDDEHRKNSARESIAARRAQLEEEEKLLTRPARKDPTSMSDPISTADPFAANPQHQQATPFGVPEASQPPTPAEQQARSARGK